VEMPKLEETESKLEEPSRWAISRPVPKHSPLANQLTVSFRERPPQTAQQTKTIWVYLHETHYDMQTFIKVRAYNLIIF
jgi:hypothetical protein